MKSLLICLFTITISFPIFSADFYWIGGGGNWSDSDHWSNTSGGTSAGSLPSSTDNVFFDNLSGLDSASAIVIIDTDISVANFNFAPNDGELTATGRIINCSNFFSDGANSILTLTDCIINVSNDTWEIINATNLTWTSVNSVINLNALGTSVFSGGDLAYNNVVSLSSVLEVNGNNSFELLKLAPSSVLTLENGSTQSFDSLSVIGSCASYTEINTTDPSGSSASLVKTGFLSFAASNLGIDNVNATTSGGQTYTLSSSVLTNSNGWILQGITYYWIGDDGSWSDVNHWSHSSGGLSAGCIPSYEDSVVFDNNSFSAANQVVLVDVEAFFSFMDWSTATNNPTLILDTTMYSKGNITLNPGLFITRTNIEHRIEFTGNSDFDPNGALIDCNFSIYTDNPSQSFLLQNELVMTDTSTIYLLSGGIDFQNHNVTTGSIIVYEIPGATKSLDFGSSVITLKIGMNSESTTNFNFSAGTSTLEIGGIDFENFLITADLDFNDVVLDFSKTGSTQLIAGSNTFNRLTILKGNDVTIEGGSTQTINNSLTMQGNCKDSIYLTSTGATAYFQKTTTANVIAECIDFTNIGATGATQTALFSTGNGSNPGWTLGATPAVTSNFTISGGVCLGDTTFFTNNSTVFSGNSNDMTSIWFFGDGSTGYYHFNSPTDSVWISYEQDTNKHVFISGGNFDVILQTTNNINFCISRDTVSVEISNPSIQALASDFDRIICQGDKVTFSATSDSPIAEFQFYLNGSPATTQSTTNTYTTTSLNHSDTISVLSFENGCPSDTMPKLGFTVNSLPDFSWVSSDSDTSICLTDNVTFTASGIDPLYTYQYLLNGNPVSPFTSAGIYSTTTLNDEDTVLIIARTTNNCRDTSSMVFDVKPLPNTTLASSIAGNVICAGEQVTFTASGADEYLFYVNGTPQGSPSTTNTFSTSSLGTGDVVAVFGYSADGCSKQAVQSFSYTVNTLPTINLVTTSPTAICSGQSVLFNVSGASQYEFFINGTSVQGPSSVNSYTTSALSDQDVVHVAGTFSGCSNTSNTYTFTVSNSPTTTLISDATANTLCFQETVTLTASGATNYEFFINGTSQGPSSTVNTFTANNLTNGQIVTVNGESNGCIVAQSITFNVLPIPSVNLFSNDPDNTICEGDVVTFTGTNAAQYQLFVNNVSQGGFQASGIFTPTLSSGNNSVYVVGNAANGCSNTSPTINIIVNPIPTITLTSSDADNEICAGETVTFTGSGSNMYQFFINGISQGSMSTTNTFTTSDLLNGQIISITGSSVGCISNSNTLTFVVNPSPNVALTSTDIDNVFCFGDNILFTASGATDYEFFVDGVSQGAPSPTSTINSTGFVTGTYLVEVYGEQNNCNSYNSKQVTVNNLPSVSISSSDLDNTICSGETVTYTASGGTLYQFLLNGTPQNTPSVLNAKTFSSLNDGDVISVNATSSQGCVASESASPIVVNSTPTVTLVSSDPNNEICINETVTFTASGANEYEFFINGASQGVASTNTQLTTSTLSTGDVITVSGTNLSCESISNALTFSVHSYPVINLINNGDITICENEPVDLVATGGISYQYLINGVPVGGYIADPTFNGVVNNNDVVTVNGQNNGCISLAPTSVQYVVYPFPTIMSLSSDADNTICKDEAVTFTVSGAMEYVFELNGNNQQSGTTSVFTTNTLETGDVVSITGYNGDCPSSVDQFVFIVNEMNLTLTASPSNMICQGETVTFTATGTDLYEFYLNGVSQGSMSASNTISLSGLSHLDEITFVGESTTTLCTQNHDDFIIMDIMVTPTISSNSSYEFCDGDSVVLISNSPYGNQWLLNGTPILGATDTFYVAYQQGIYSLETTHGGNGSIWSFGGNASGVFGNGANFNSLTPTKAEITGAFKELSSGADFVLALSELGQVYSWGKNNFGQLGKGTYTSSNIPTLLPSLSDIKTVATTETSSIAVTNTGNVYVWGENALGQLATGNTSVINFPYQNSALTNVDTIAGGKNHFIFLKNDGTVWATGHNASGQLGQGNLSNSLNAVQVSGLTNIVSIGAGEYSGYAIDNTGNLYVWGENNNGQLGLGDLTNRLTPVMSPLKKVKSAQGGATHSVFVTTDKEVYTTGGNNYGQLGLNDNVNRTVPTKVNLGGVQQASAGQYTTLLQRSDNSVFGFGDNSHGQLSTVTGTSINTPSHISNLDGVVFIEAGRLTSHAIYGKYNSCTATTNADVIVHTFPPVVITVTSDTVLTATAGANAYQWYMDNLAIPGATSQTYHANTTGNYTVKATFANGCMGISDEQYVGFIGLEENEFYLNIIGYPNPTRETFYLNFNNFLEGEPITIIITDYTGREVKRLETTIQPLIEIPLEGLSSGSYQTVVRYESYEKVMRLVKVD